MKLKENESNHKIQAFQLFEWGGGLSHKIMKNCQNRKFVVVSFDTQIAFHIMWLIVTVRKIENFTYNKNFENWVSQDTIDIVTIIMP